MYVCMYVCMYHHHHHQGNPSVYTRAQWETQPGTNDQGAQNAYVMELHFALNAYDFPKESSCI